MAKTSYYLLKVRGHKRNLDYLQVRNEQLSLLANLRCIPPFDNICRVFKCEDQVNKVKNIIATIPIGKLTKIEI